MSSKGCRHFLRYRTRLENGRLAYEQPNINALYPTDKYITKYNIGGKS